nr:hypothetical protein [Saccharopolyspora hordei]
MLDVLTAEWDEVAERLDPEAFTRLVSLVGELQGSDADTAALVTEDIAVLLGEVLPVEHPVRRALAESETRFGRSDVEWDRLSGGLRDRLTGSAPRPDLERLRSVDALDEQQVVAAGLEPEDPSLIRLPGEGGDRWPAFQFGADGAPREVVRAVNRLLHAGEDPWGAADWWLGHHTSLGGVPAQLLGQVDDDALIDAARDESAEV